MNLQKQQRVVREEAREREKEPKGACPAPLGPRRNERIATIKDIRRVGMGLSNRLELFS